MSCPCIVIQRHDVGLYEWSVFYEQEKIDGDVGDSSITECLISAVAALPESEPHTEIKYRGIHMGTFQTEELHEYSEGVSERIVASYGALVQNF